MGDNPQKVKKSTKKMSEEPQDQLLPDLDTSPASDIGCQTCGIRFSSDAKAYENHMQGKKHQKKVAEAKLMAKNLAAKNTASEDDKDEDEDEGDLHCEVCDKDFSSYISYVAHVKGNLHAKNLKKQKLMRQLHGMPEVLDPEDQDGDGGDDDDDGILPKTYARCKVCQKEFQGPESYKKHLESAVHKKKVKQSRVVQALKPHQTEGASANDSGDEDFFSKCDVCQKSFSGVVPYKIHMESSVHKKSLEKRKVAEELKEHYTSEGPSPGYLCKECNKSFTDPVAFKCHLSKNSHEKQKAKGVLLEFLNAHPEIVIVYPLDKDGSGDEVSDSDDGADSSYYLICKLCHVSFSGPESAQDHVRSKKHASLKKEKKMQKLLKEQRKHPDDKSSQKGNKADKSSAEGKSENGKTESSENSLENNNVDDFEMI